MRITFVLPGVAAETNGGVKVVYEYANGLARRGHQVHVVHPRTWGKMSGAAQAVKARLWPLSIKLRFGGAAPWMKIEPGVRQHLIPNLLSRNLPEADAVFATFFRTAPYISDLEPSRGRKYYLVQHYEVWAGSKEDVDYTWRLPMHKIVISKWLESIAREFGEEARTSHIPNGMDFDQFKLTRPIAGREARVVLLLNPNEFKGSVDGIKALTLVKHNYPELKVTGFGTAPRDESWPEWLEYHQLPSPHQLVDIYNSGTIFLQPSHAEGWGLTSTEAMACGCALVTTDNGGSGDFAIAGDTALVVPVKDIDAMAASMTQLLENDALRQQIAESGRRFVQQFTWDRAVSALESTLLTSQDDSPSCVAAAG